MNAAMLDRLNAWAARAVPAASAEQVDAAAMVLDAVYAVPPRPYHSLEHIADCLGVFDEFRGEAQHPDAVEFALWTHDAIYVATRSDNEARSAGVARLVLAGLGAAGLSPIVGRLVLATTHRTPPTTGDEGLIMDIDMTILGADPDRYRTYAGAIREEYRFADDAAYARGRSAFLRGLLERPWIYRTTAFQHRFEDRARSNIQGELAAFSTV